MTDEAQRPTSISQEPVDIPPVSDSDTDLEEEQREAPYEIVKTLGERGRELATRTASKLKERITKEKLRISAEFLTSIVAGLVLKELFGADAGALSAAVFAGLLAGRNKNKEEGFRTTHAILGAVTSGIAAAWIVHDPHYAREQTAQTIANAKVFLETNAPGVVAWVQDTVSNIGRIGGEIAHKAQDKLVADVTPHIEVITKAAIGTITSVQDALDMQQQQAAVQATLQAQKSIPTIITTFSEAVASQPSFGERVGDTLRTFIENPYVQAGGIGAGGYGFVRDVLPFFFRRPKQEKDTKAVDESLAFLELQKTPTLPRSKRRI